MRISGMPNIMRLGRQSMPSSIKIPGVRSINVGSRIFKAFKPDFARMMPLTNVSVKSYFFNSRHIRELLGGVMYYTFRRFGAYVRQRAKSSIRKRKSGKSSLPGHPSRSHTGHLKHNIFFAYNPAVRSVVIGPVLLEGRKNLHVAHNTLTVPEALEFGGRSWSPIRRKVLIIRKRPYMWPAFKYVVQKELKGIWEYCTQRYGGMNELITKYQHSNVYSMKQDWNDYKTR